MTVVAVSVTCESASARIPYALFPLAVEVPLLMVEPLTATVDPLTLRPVASSPVPPLTTSCSRVSAELPLIAMPAVGVFASAVPAFSVRSEMVVAVVMPLATATVLSPALVAPFTTVVTACALVNVVSNPPTTLMPLRTVNREYGPVPPTYRTTMSSS